MCLKHEIISSDYNNNNALIQLEKRLDIICGLGLVDLGHFAQYFHIYERRKKHPCFVGGNKSNFKKKH